MLYVSLVLSAVLLIAAHLAARPHPERPRLGELLIFGGLGGLLLCLMTFVSVVAWAHFALLALALLVWHGARRAIPYFLPFSLVATALAYGVGTIYAFSEAAALRAKYPVESLEGRLADRPASGHAPALTDDEAAGLTELEDELNRRGRPWRAEALQQLHERTAGDFVNASGFGVARLTSPSFRLEGRYERPPPEQPGDWPLEAPQSTYSPSPVADGLRALHADSALDFLNPAGFGYFRDRRYVLGFQPHGFSDVPGPAKPWRVARVELVSLLLLPEPAVYVSPRLPAMQELRGAPTRPLDGVEAAALARLRKGEGLVVASSGGGLRMLGALRRTKQCVDCHGGERGDLLGAFSYALRPADEGR